MLEAIAIIGALLLALDRRIEGGARERSVVAYYRARGGAQACAWARCCLIWSSALVMNCKS